MVFLIDGYNLLYAIGLASRRMPAKQFERARLQLLDWLADRKPDDGEFILVFDAQNRPSPSAESEHRGLKVQFAHGQTADEQMEQMLRQDRQASRLAVVSNDSQVQMAARRRGSMVFTCQEFVDRLIAKRSETPELRTGESDKVENASAQEQAEWLEVFSKPPPRRKRK